MALSSQIRLDVYVCCLKKHCMYVCESCLPLRFSLCLYDAGTVDTAAGTPVADDNDAAAASADACAPRALWTSARSSTLSSTFSPTLYPTLSPTSSPVPSLCTVYLEALAWLVSSFCF